MQCNPSSCQPGYSCGHYGCARNRARSALTQKDGVVVPLDVFVNSTLPRRNIFGVERKRTEDPADKIDEATFGKLTVSAVRGPDPGPTAEPQLPVPTVLRGPAPARLLPAQVSLQRLQQGCGRTGRES